MVIANPPYSANQGDANNNNQNVNYPALDAPDRRHLRRTFNGDQRQHASHVERNPLGGERPESGTKAWWDS